MTIQNHLASVLSFYGLCEEDSSVQLHGSGLINTTWKVSANGKDYILQKINETVFKQPRDIAHNIGLIAQHLKQNNPDYLLIVPLKTKSGKDLVYLNGAGYFRMFPFVQNSFVKTVVEEAQQAYEAARQFGLFTHVLAGIDLSQFKPVIPNFHNLSLRFQQFTEAVNADVVQRAGSASLTIKKVLSYSHLVKRYEACLQQDTFPLRIAHHDTKISNVLFDKAGKGLCVIDLDTVMPGYFFSDAGDMLRTLLSPVSEEEIDFSKIEIRKEYFAAIKEGYCIGMGNTLTHAERGNFLFAGQCMIYMQALRFLTDYIAGDVYYVIHYTDQNLSRAKNQLVLLDELTNAAPFLH